MSRIYVVEDDESISALIAAVLSAAGHEVRTMESGEALEKLVSAGETPDLLLLDIMLPGKDGLQLLSEWKARPEHVGDSVQNTVGQGRGVGQGARP